ncbi:MAG: HAMP domain-containing histidine kinase [Defluviitaleaceae bacterium]|nr:HAMP domain-containing histidine kinase [Defluviitaleaceae bacterium]
MFIPKKEIDKLSADIRRIIDGHTIDLRDNLEGRLSALKNDIHTLAGRLNEQSDNSRREKIALADSLANISHQLKTPLAAMSVMVDLLEDAPSEKRAEFIANLKQGLAQTNRLADSLLKMAKLDSGSVEFFPVKISARELFDLALAPMQILPDIKGQTVKFGGGAELFCDKNWTAEALGNVIKNASEHSPEGGEIFVTAGENPLCTWVSVSDSGAGVPREKMRDIFRRFGGSAGGTGIGLPLALDIMQRQNGDISVENNGERGRGACFTLKFF